MKIGYLGPEGSMDGAAALAYAKALNMETLALPRPASGLCRTLAAGEVDRGILPAENLRRGEIRGTYEALHQAWPEVVIVDSLVQDLDYALATRLADHELSEVWAPQEVLDQCSPYLGSEQAGLRKEAVPTVAEALRKIEEDKLSGVGVLGPESLLEERGFPILARNLVPGNQTLYFVLAPGGTEPQQESHVTEISLTLTKDRPYWLHEVTGFFKDHEINMTDIFRTPVDRGYRFLIGLEGAPREAKIKDCLKSLEQGLKDTELRVLGAYPNRGLDRS